MLVSPHGRGGAPPASPCLPPQPVGSLSQRLFPRRGGGGFPPPKNMRTGPTPRRWILHAPTRSMGSGSTPTANALTVFGGETVPGGAPAWVPWPKPSLTKRKLSKFRTTSAGAPSPSRPPQEEERRIII